MIALGVALLAVGLTVSVGSGILETQAADRQRIPLWGNGRDYRRPRATVIVQLAAALLVGFGAIILVVAWGPTAIYLFGFVIVPYLLVVALHNRHVRVRQLARERNNTRFPEENSVARTWSEPVDPPRAGTPE